MIWIIAGTSESYSLINELEKNINFNLIATTTTNYGKKLLEEKHKLKCVIRRMNKNEMEDFIKKYDIKYVIDASHPFAEETSLNAISAAQNEGIKYLRYERKNLNLSKFCNEKIIKVKSYQDAALKAAEFQRIFLTTGSKTADVFIKNITNFKERLFLRTLPNEKFISRLTSSGLTPDNILALKGPFSREFNRAIYKEYKADIIISKASGVQGGLKTKIEAALDLNLPIIIIERPQINYPLLFREVNNLIDYIRSN